MLKKLFQGFYFVKNIFNRSKIFFEENPKRIKLLGVLVIFLALLLTIISALTIQNLTQRASGGDFTFEITRGPGSYKILTEKEESKLSNTVYILIRNLPSDWFLSSSQSNNTLGVQAYATNQIDCYGTPCNLGDRCEKVNEGDGTFSGICFSNPVNTPTPTLNINNPIISFTPTPTSFIACNSPDYCASNGECSKDRGKSLGARNCIGQEICCQPPPPTPTPTFTPTPVPPTPTPTIDPYRKIILHEMLIENADTDGGSGGSSPSTYIYDNPNQTNQTLPIGSTWTLNRLLSGQIKAIRTVRITLFGTKGEQISTTASIMLVRSLSTPTPIPTLIPSPTPTKSPSEIKTGGPQFTSILEKCSSIGAFVYAGIVHGKAIGGVGRTTATVCCPTDTPFFCGSEQHTCVTSKNDCSQLLLTPSPTRIITQAPILVGDLNEDGKVNDTDTKILLSQYGQKGANLSGDLFKDNVVDEIDYNTIIRSYTPNLWFGVEQQP